MRKYVCVLFLLFFIHKTEAQNLYSLVNPFIGTGGHGHTFPGATAPFGFCQLSPDTRIDGSWDGCGGYHYSDSIIYGFSHTHLSGTGVSDYGDILVMPIVNEMALNNYQYQSPFYHKTEKADAGYYKVFLEKPKIEVELTTSRRCGFHQYTFPNNTNHYVVLDLKHRDEVLESKMEQIDAHTIRGYRYSKAWAQNQKIFFEIQFEDEIENIIYEAAPSPSPTMILRTDKSLHAIIQLKKKNSNTVKIKVGLSGVDETGAHENLQNEIPHWDFYKTKKWVQDEWNKELSKIEVKEKNNAITDKSIIFYTSLYHCMIAPNIFNDVDGRYRGRDDKIHNTDGKFDYYTVFSLWDTYRALHPLLTIIDEKRTNDFINTFIKQYEQGGRLPVWEFSSNETDCMIGYHAVSVIWDAYNKGIRNYDVEKAFEAMKSIANENSPAINSYKKFAFVRAEDDAESVSKTLEFAYDDWCIAEMAKALGKEEDYKVFLHRSQNWVNVYDPSTGFMRARKNGTLMKPFSPYLVDNNYTEANSWQYSFSVPQDIHGLELISSRDFQFDQKLDSLFKARPKTEGREQSDITGLIGQYAHGNEPSHHIVYLYSYLSEYKKADALIDFICKEFYKNTPDGLIGNEDCGQMSAWYVFSAMGFYPLCPGKETYTTGNKQFEYCKVNHKTLIKNDSIFNGDKGWFSENSNCELSHYKLKNNNNLFIKKYRCNDTLQISSIIANPFIVEGQRIFKDSFLCEIQSATSSATIFYKINNSPFNLYTKAFQIKENSRISFFSVGKFNDSSAIQEATFTILPTDVKVQLNAKYSPTYHAGGPMGLVDGIYGKANWRAGDWQGYQGQDFEVIISFDKQKNIKELYANFLQDQRAWIFYPSMVLFEFSDDNVHWNKIGSKNLEVTRDENCTIQKIGFTMADYKQNIQAKYIRVKAKNYGFLPSWHPGAGNPAYIFIDEIEWKE